VPDPLPERRTQSLCGVDEPPEDPVDDPPEEPVAEPFTPRETESPPAVKLTFVAKLPAPVGWNRTTTDRLAPAASENDPPETTRNGEPTLTPPEMLDPVVFCTVNVRSTLPPAATLPKDTVLEGDTLRAPRATLLTVAEQALSLPLRSTAETRNWYVVPAFNPAIVVLTR
jgi:hypothetical protein